MLCPHLARENIDSCAVSLQNRPHSVHAETMHHLPLGRFQSICSCFFIMANPSLQRDAANRRSPELVR